MMPALPPVKVLPAPAPIKFSTPAQIELSFPPAIAEKQEVLHIKLLYPPLIVEREEHIALPNPPKIAL
jgi:hypothetical protein